MGKYVYCLIGESGSGKTTLAEALAEHGMKQLWSYTTRPPRCEHETGHIFMDEFPRGTDCVAYTKFDGYEYWSTADQIEKSDVYVIDPAGVEFLLNRYRGTKTPVLIYVETSRRTRKLRMLHRGDSRKQVRRRLTHDAVAFAEFRRRLIRCQLPFRFITINNDGDAELTKRELWAVVEAIESADPTDAPVDFSVHGVCV